MRLDGKVALITGAGSGIGAAIAALFAAEGAKIGVNDVNEDAAQKVTDELRQKGGAALALPADITNKAQVQALVARFAEEFGGMDILVNNAGINRDSTMKKMTELQWDEVLNVNLKGTFIMCQAVIAPMIERGGGRIINTSSIGALGNIGQANYSASKAGVAGLTRTLALELARHNILVNCVAPGATDTPMTAALPPEIKKMIEAKIPLRRFAKTDEIAALHLFLAADEASYITGQTIFVDGGISVGI